MTAKLWFVMTWPLCAFMVLIGRSPQEVDDYED